MKNRFIKNLYQNLCNGGVLLLLDIVLIAGYCFSLAEPQPNDGWILLVIVLLISMLFFIIGFYWIFKMVEIRNCGITVKLMNKTLRDYSWDEISSITQTIYMKNPALKIEIANEKPIYLDDRKPIVRAIEFYSGKQVVK